MSVSSTPRVTVQAPSTWRDPASHFEVALTDPWYRMLLQLTDLMQRSTVQFWAGRGVRAAYLPVTTGSISSPMGLGSDSTPVKIELEGVPTYLADSMRFLLELGQGALAHVLRSGELDRVARDVIAPHYGAQREVAEQCLDTLLPADVRWRSHTGAGMFSWLWFDEPWFDDLELYRRMKRENVFVVPGRHFFVDPAEHDHARRCVRLSLSAEADVLRRGIEVLARVVGEMRDAAEGGGRCD